VQGTFVLDTGCWYDTVHRVADSYRPRTAFTDRRCDIQVGMPRALWPLPDRNERLQAHASRAQQPDGVPAPGVTHISTHRSPPYVLYGDDCRVLLSHWPPKGICIHSVYIYVQISLYCRVLRHRTTPASSATSGRATTRWERMIYSGPTGSSNLN
jgi:hypothetical protein